MTFKVDSVTYNHEYKVIGKHPDGRIFAVSHQNKNGLYVVDRDLNLVETLNTTLENYDANGLGNGITECTILSTGTMLAWGMYRTGNNQTKIWRSTNTTYTEFEEVFSLPNDITFIEGSVGVSTLDDTIMCCEYTTVLYEEGTNIFLPPLELNVWKGTNDGRDWEVVVTRNRNPQFEGDIDVIRHFHTVRYDAYENIFWIGSGDGGHQCAIYTINPDGTNFKIIFQGVRDIADGQMYRTTSFMFTDNFIWWGSDAQKEGYHPFGRINRSTRTYEALMEPNDCVRFSKKINHPTGDFLIANKTYEKAPTNPEGITELYVCDNFETGEWYPIYSWKAADLGSVSVAYGIVDNKDGRTYVHSRRIIDDTGTPRNATTTILDVGKETGHDSLVKVYTSGETLEIPLFNCGELPTEGVVKIQTPQGLMCFKLDDFSESAIKIKIKTPNGIKYINNI